MKNLPLITALLFSIHLQAQQVKSGINTDVGQHLVGVRPYESKPMERKATLDFMDCTRWFLRTDRCEATLIRSNEEIVTADYSGKIVYKATDRSASIFVGLQQPLTLDKPWDCVDVWTFGDHWLWGEPHFSTAFQLYAVFRGKDGKEHEFNVVQSGYTPLAHKYWFMNHLKLKDGDKQYTHFLGFLFKGNNLDVGTYHAVFLSSIYIYKEELKPLTFKPFPKELPFPLRKQTILPFNKQEKFANSVAPAGNDFTFKYKGTDVVMAYCLPKDNVLGDIRIYLNGKLKQTICNRNLYWKNGEKAILTIDKVCADKDTLRLSCSGQYEGKRIPFEAWYTINQKSLIFHLEEKEEEGNVSRLTAGHVELGNGILTQIPYLKYNNGDRPSILYKNDLFTFLIFDWYATHASLVTMGQQQNDFTGGEMVYIPKTNGVRNPLVETLFINASPDVQEVLPTVDNPASPMRSLQANRVWAINGGADLKQLCQFVTDLRSRGVENVTIRYHEDFWREGGESYTFKLTPNPKLGVEGVRKYVEFVKSNDWRIGLYSNYTDMAPVNSLFNPDWMKQGPNGEWEVSWSRCYSPKPQIAWEQEAILAPQIKKIYNPNHSYCDVHTAISPLTRVDYDFRVPDAAMMRGVYNRYGMLLMNERKAYNGPVYSEGGHHWWYAGLLDGNYANDDLQNLPIFPDFNLLKIHPLEMDAANTGQGHQYVSYAFAYGHLGILSEGIDAVTRYAFLQPMQEDYVMIPIRSITYYKSGKSYTPSEAIKAQILKEPAIRVEYESGLQVYVNFNQENWQVKIGDKEFVLPKYGFFAYMPGSGRHSSSVLLDGNRLDEVYSSKLYYLNTHGSNVKAPLGGNGHYLVKKEKFSWEIIPLATNSRIEFSLDLLGESFKEARIVGVDQQGCFLKNIAESDNGTISIQSEEAVYKYQIMPK